MDGIKLTFEDSVFEYIVDEAVAVSYTHLDVYKRQPLLRPP